MNAAGDRESETAQRLVCARFGVKAFPVRADSKVGIARNVRDGVYPVNGLRHPPSVDTSGWYIWAGDVMSHDPDFFVPLHVEHLRDWCPQAVPYLQLPPGWRFLLAPGTEDVWQDLTLLDVDR